MYLRRLARPLSADSSLRWPRVALPSAVDSPCPSSRLGGTAASSLSPASAHLRKKYRVPIYFLTNVDCIFKFVIYFVIVIILIMSPVPDLTEAAPPGVVQV